MADSACCARVAATLRASGDPGRCCRSRSCRGTAIESTSLFGRIGSMLLPPAIGAVGAVGGVSIQRRAR